MTSKTSATARYIGKDVPLDIALPLILARIFGRRHFAESGCHEYTGYIHPLGYGEIVFQGKPWKVHRLVYVALHGPIPDWPEGVVMHSCDNRKCINDDHLSLSSQQDNIRDCVDKGRQASARKTHCPAGHEYAIYGREYSSDSCIQQANPWRACTMCARIKSRRKAGWPEHLLHLPPQKPGARPDFANAKPGDV